MNKLGLELLAKHGSAPVPLTEAQLEAWGIFACRVLEYLKDIHDRTGEIGMTTARDLSLKHNHRINKATFPGGYVAAMDKMEAEGLFVRVRGKNGSTLILYPDVYEELLEEYPDTSVDGGMDTNQADRLAAIANYWDAVKPMLFPAKEVIGHDGI